MVARTLDSLMGKLVRWRWQIVIALSLSILVLEILEHRPYPFYPIHWYFLMEVFFFNIIVPMLLLTSLTLHDSNSKLSQALTLLSLQKTISRQLSQAKDWEDLANILLQIPRAILPVSGSRLTLFNNQTGKFDLIWQWSQGESLSSFNPSLPPLFECSFMQDPQAAIQSELPDCGCDLLQQPGQAKKIHCIRLESSHHFWGWIHLYFDPKSPPNPAQIDQLTSLGPDMSLAIEQFGLIHSSEFQTKMMSAERQRLARYLHDSLAHDLAYIRLKSDQILLENQNAAQLPVFADIEHIRDAANQAYEQVRISLAELQGQSTKDIMVDLEEFARDSAARSGLILDIKSYGDQKLLSSHLSRQLLIVLREAIRNIELHAKAHQVSLCLYWHKENLEIQVWDDGVGFHPDQIKTADHHFGVEMMREIIDEINGQMTICSEPDQGTKINLRIPIV